MLSGLPLTGLDNATPSCYIVFMLPQLDECNWAEVFGDGSFNGALKPSGPPMVDMDFTTFGRADVAEILAICEGEHDGPAWICWGILKDRRYFVARGSCCYTGWDCNGGNSANVAQSEEDLIRYGMNEDERVRFNVRLPEDHLTN